MKKLTLFFALFVFCVAQAYAQAGGEITPKGITFPRYTDANRPTGPLAVGTVIFNTSQNTHQSWNGSAWQNLVIGGGGSGPWSVNGNSVFVNSANRVGINTASPAATLEIQGGLLASKKYDVTTLTPTNTYIIPYNGTIAPITNAVGWILDPGGNGNFVANTNYASYVKLQYGYDYRFTFESLDLGSGVIIFSSSSDVNDTKSYILKVDDSSYYATGQSFNLRDAQYIHFKIRGDGGSAPGFKLLFQYVQFSTERITYSEPIYSGVSFNSGISSFAAGRSRATGVFSTAMGRFSTASGFGSTALGEQANTNYFNTSFAIGGASTASRATNDKDYQMKMHFDEFKFLTGAANDVTIIDGKVTTSNTLWVYGSVNNALANYGYLNNNPSALTGFVSSATIPLSIYASGRMVCPEFNAFSDARHKKLRSYSNGSTDLALLNQLKVSNYTFIDTVGKGGKVQMGFIAQEVEKIVPEAINKIQDYIPNIYDMAKSIAYDATAHTLTVTTNKPHDFQAKDEIKLISLDKEHKVKVESIIDAHTFVVANWEKPVDKLFVFGKQVDDFRTVDYDRLFTLGISSIQELSRKVDQLEKENVLLKAYNEEFSQMKNEVAELKAMISRTSLSDKGIAK